MDEWVIEAVNEYCISKGLFDVNEELVRCKDCKHFSATTLGMPYACWRGGERVWGETGEHARHTLCIRVDSPDWFCADGERKEE